jgi:hypothetical protein
MIVDDDAVSKALHGIETEVAPDLLSRVRQGGRRRLLRRRTYVAVSAVAVGTAAVPAGVALWPRSRAAVTTPASGHQPQTVSGLYAAPPAPGSQCNSGYTAHADATTYPQLLLMPTDQPLKYAFVRDSRSTCLEPHVALTAYQLSDHDDVTAGVVVEGPNAPTPTEDGRAGPGVDFMGDTAHDQVDGQRAVEYSIPQSGDNDVYWTEPDGGQWHASVAGMPEADAVQLLDQLTFDGEQGAATFGGGADHGWTIASKTSDLPRHNGWVTEQWTDAAGHQVNLDLTQEPSHVSVEAARMAGRAKLVTVRGNDGVLVASSQSASLTWQEASDVEATLSVVDGTATEVTQLTDNLAMTTPDDPRISPN